MIEVLRKVEKRGALDFAKRTKQRIASVFAFARLWAAAHNGALPVRTSGEIPEFPGQTWRDWENNIGRGLWGLDKSRNKGLGNLFQNYGLKTARTAHPIVVRQAIENVLAGMPHGLVALKKNDAQPSPVRPGVPALSDNCDEANHG